MIHLACGGIAQLGERLNGIQEVSGSIPLISTKQKTHIVIYVSLLLYYYQVTRGYEDEHPIPCSFVILHNKFTIP